MDGKLDAGVLSPELHQTLLAVARLRNTVSSFRIEGEHIEIERAREVIDSGAPRSETELGVLRLAQCYTEVAGGKLPDLTVEGVRLLHERLFKGVLEKGFAGKLKTEQNWIDGPGRVPVFYPTPPERTVPELETLFAWLDENGHAYPTPVTAALFFAEFQGIHPFYDGNGRIGRLLALRVLYGMGMKNAPLVPLDTLFFRSSAKYYEMLGTTNDGKTYDLWTRFFVQSLETAYRLALKRSDLSRVVERMNRPATRALFRWAISTDGDWFVHGDYPNPDGYSENYLSEAFAELAAAGVFEGRGEKKGRRYRLATAFLVDAYNIEDAAIGRAQA